MNERWLKQAEETLRAMVKRLAKENALLLIRCQELAKEVEQLKQGAKPETENPDD